MPSWLVRTVLVVIAVPFGWMLGVAAAELTVGREMGVFPVLTIPFGLAAAIAFALSRTAPPFVRLAVMVAGTAAIILLA